MCLPHEQRLEELYDDDEAERDEYEAQVEQQHQAAHALGVRTERVGRGHGLDGDARLARDLRLDRGGHVGRRAPVAPVRVVAGHRAPAPVRVVRAPAENGRRRVCC